MPDLSLVILYVDNPAARAAFYAGLLGPPLAEASPIPDGRLRVFAPVAP